MVGRHDGLMYYTLGQRRGLGIGGAGDGERWFVVEKDLARNELVVTQGETELLFSQALRANSLNWFAGRACAAFRCTVKHRYRQPDQDAVVEVWGEECLVRFDKPQRAVTPGQWVVFYHGEICLGGGIICEKISKLN